MTYWGVRGCQSVPRSPECLVYHGNKTVILNSQFLLMQYFYLCPCLQSMFFIHVRQQIFTPAVFYYNLRRFNICNQWLLLSWRHLHHLCFHSDYWRFARVHRRTGTRKRTSVRMGPTTQQLPVFKNVEWEQPFFPLLSCFFNTSRPSAFPLMNFRCSGQPLTSWGGGVFAKTHQ